MLPIFGKKYAGSLKIYALLNTLSHKEKKTTIILTIEKLIICRWNNLWKTQGWRSIRRNPKNNDYIKLLQILILCWGSEHMFCHFAVNMYMSVQNIQIEIFGVIKYNIALKYLEYQYLKVNSWMCGTGNCRVAYIKLTLLQVTIVNFG